MWLTSPTLAFDLESTLAKENVMEMFVCHFLQEVGVGMGTKKKNKHLFYTQKYFLEYQTYNS